MIIKVENLSVIEFELVNFKTYNNQLTNISIEKLIAIYDMCKIINIV